jgi:hypothetical protein
MFFLPFYLLPFTFLNCECKDRDFFRNNQILTIVVCKNLRKGLQGVSLLLSLFLLSYRQIISQPIQREQLQDGTVTAEVSSFHIPEDTVPQAEE